MKRYTSLDINAITRELRDKVVGLRIANVYDLGKKTYQLKLAKPDHKEYLVIESGVRLHTTKFQRERQSVPSVFCLKLRRYLRTKRIEDVRQLGIDRVIDITIGSGEAQHHLLIELYSSGNIILADKNYTIETLIRSYKTGEGTENEVSVVVGAHYPVEKARQPVPTTLERLQEVLQSVAEENRSKESLKDVLNKHLDLGPTLIEHCLLSAGIKANTKLTECNTDVLAALHQAIGQAESLYANPTLKGHIVLKDQPAQSTKATDGSVVSTTGEPLKEDDYDSRLFVMFMPYVYKQFENRPRLEFTSFDEAVDIFFSKAEEQQVEVKKEQQEKTVVKKLDKVKKDHETRIAALTKAEEECITKAQLIEANVEDVDAAIKITCSELARGVDWTQLGRIVKEAKKAGDPVANLIHSLDLANNRITLLLTDPLGAVADASHAMHKVEVDISLTAYANAQEYYAESKRRASKHAKTVAASQMAIKAAERKARREIKDVGVKAAIQKVRKAYWFEKFNWFISSENYVVISGRDAQQNELIVKRYLRKGDAYVHADVHGAATCVVKNPHPDKPIPALTLSEAGAMTVCRSSAWNAKIPTSAWWVHPEQVSKTAPSGEYLVTGSFMIRGKKNFLPPAQLTMGFAFMFKVDPTSLANHVNERVVRTLVEASDGDAHTKSTDKSLSEDESEEDESNIPEDNSSSTGKYRVQVLMDTPDDENEAAAPQRTADKARRPRMSAAEKRRKKKQDKRSAQLPEQGNQAEENKQEAEEDEEEEGEDQARHDTNRKPKGPVQPKLPRGKKGKIKKMKKKYAEQDEEERELRMQLLQSEGLKKKEEQRAKEAMMQKRQKGGNQRPRQAMAEPKAPHKPVTSNTTATSAPKGTTEAPKSSTSGDSEQQQQQEVTNQETQIRHSDSEPDAVADQDAGAEDLSEEEKPSDEGASEELEAKRKRRQEKRKEKKREEEEVRQIMEEENIKMVDESLLSELDALTGVPVAEDALLFAVPVCAPYSVVQSYKYKVKLVPGSVKRGKAGKEALAYFLSFPEATDRERDLIKAVDEPEIALQMIGNVRIATSGLKQKGKGGKKKK